MSPVVRLSKKFEKEIAAGCPWVMRHMAVESSQWLAAPGGSICRVESERGALLGIGLLNPQSQIVVRMLSAQDDIIDEHFFAQRFSAALAKRAWAQAPYYRLVHAEADFLPGLIIDRFGEVLVAQVASSGMEALQPVWLAALERVVAPISILLRNDFGARRLEGLPQEVRCIKGEVSGLATVIENGCTYFADLKLGQKTGWFYDMRDNRLMVAELAKDKTMFDVFSHSGGFGVLAAKMGAREVTMVDASELALALAMKAAQANGVAEICATIRGDAVKIMQLLAEEGKTYDIVVADPPAYVKSKKDIASGLKGYAKVAQAAAKLVAPGGLLFTASCSHHASRGAFNKAVLEAIKKTGRKAEILKQSGASCDHPVHPKLPQGEYLKGLLLRLN